MVFHVAVSSSVTVVAVTHTDIITPTKIAVLEACGHGIAQVTGIASVTRADVSSALGTPTVFAFAFIRTEVTIPLDSTDASSTCTNFTGTGVVSAGRPITGHVVVQRIVVVSEDELVFALPIGLE